MNIVLTSQGVGLKIFFHLLNKIRVPLNIDNVGFYVAQSMDYDQLIREYPRIESNHVVVKEWEIVEKSRKKKPNLGKIRFYEEAIGNPTLWEPLICDRRIYLGRWCKEKQDYRPSFSHEEMLSILQAALEEIEQLLKMVKPDIVLSLDPATFGDYLLYLFCKSRSIPMLFFRTTKIKNYIELNEGIFGCSPHIYKLFQEYEEEGSSDQWIKEAKTYLESVKRENIRYEGMILIPSKRKKGKSGTNLIINFIKVFKGEIKYLLKYRKDSQIPGIFTPFFYMNFISPFKARLRNWQYSRQYILESQLDSINFAFYPLQSEPELSSLIWGKPYMNQIETIRNISRSLPVGMKLLVKEHPRALGYRSSGYYKKILEIPNVLLVHPDIEVRSMIKKAKIVIAISTFVAFEAVIHKVPSITLGGPRPFSILPDSMIRYIHSINDLAEEIADLIKNYEYKEKPFVHYIAATMRGSAPINYFTAILKKQERYGDQGVDKFDEEIGKMAEYTIKRINELF